MFQGNSKGISRVLHESLKGVSRMIEVFLGSCKGVSTEILNS